MKALLVIMTGIGFTLGVVLGLLLHLPTDSLPAEHNSLLSSSNSRHKRNANDLVVKLSNGDDNNIPDGLDNAYDVIRPPRLSSSLNASGVKEGNGRVNAAHNPVMNATAELNANKREDEKAGIEVQRLPPVLKQKNAGQQDRGVSGDANYQRRGETDPSFEGDSRSKQSQGINSFDESRNDTPKSPLSHSTKSDDANHESHPEASGNRVQSPEDVMYLNSLVRGIYWTDKLEKSCPGAFKSTEIVSWKKKSESLDVVKMEEGCGRMQNRLVTFRDASKACARYRLNADQIQGEIFSYYLSKLLNIPNLPPTALALVNSVDKKWRTVHLDLSLAQWADSKVVVLTQFIDGLEAAHIPHEFREDHRQLHPILAHLGSKSPDELCELVQWSDLIVFDYLTANLDRVINNMFNRQWNDQIMESPAHNLEKFKNGHLLFLDNESGLFHGFRLIDKYESLHRALLDSLCVFRPSTASAIKRLAASGSVGPELRALFKQQEPLHKHVANLPQKNLKILQRRIEQVNEQILKCEKLFNS